MDYSLHLKLSQLYGIQKLKPGQKVKQLPKDQELALINEYQSPHCSLDRKQAIEKLFFELNILTIIKFATKFLSQMELNHYGDNMIEITDLINQGYVVVVKCLKMFGQPSRNYKTEQSRKLAKEKFKNIRFNTLLTWWLRPQLTNYYNSVAGDMYIPLHLRMGYNIKKYHDALQAQKEQLKHQEQSKQDKLSLSSKQLQKQAQKTPKTKPAVVDINEYIKQDAKSSTSSYQTQQKQLKKPVFYTFISLEKNLNHASTKHSDEVSLANSLLLSDAFDEQVLFKADFWNTIKAILKNNREYTFFKDLITNNSYGYQKQIMIKYNLSHAKYQTMLKTIWNKILANKAKLKVFINNQ